jgi:hypothetical protein
MNTGRNRCPDFIDIEEGAIVLVMTLTAIFFAT